MPLWLLQMALNFLWSPIFFSAHLPGVALAIILALFAVILAFIACQWNSDRISSVIFLPYAAWVAQNQTAADAAKQAAFAAAFAANVGGEPPVK